MYYQFGNYIHANNEVQLTISQKTNFSARGYLMTTRVTHNISGKLLSSDGTSATLTGQLNLLEAAYGTNGYSAGLYQDNGTPCSALHILNSPNSLGGVRVVSPPSYPKGDGTDYVGYRSYSITLEADYLYSGTNILEWSETITVEGTGEADIIYLETLEGIPEPQTASQYTMCRATQSGSSKGVAGYLDFPAPIWPEFEKGKMRKRGETTPTIVSGGVWQYPRTWSHTYESNQPFDGSPTTLF